MQVLMVILRSIVAVAVLFIISRVTGERQISQLTFYDYIVGITIGSIAAMAVETDISLWLVLAAMIIFGGFTLLLSFVTTKSIVLRRLLTGVPHVMIYNGKIIKKNLKKHFTTRKKRMPSAFAFIYNLFHFLILSFLTLFRSS